MIRFITFSFLSACIMLLSNVGYAQDLKIMPMGNSLTYGWYGDPSLDELSIGYRKKLYDLLNAAGYDFDFVGHRSGGSMAGLPDDEHCGIPKITDNDLADTVTKSYLNTYQPDIILLHIGTNDLVPTPPDDNFFTGIGKLLDNVDTYETEYSRDVLVFVAKIIQFQNDDGDCDPSGLWKVNGFNSGKIEIEVNKRINNDGDLLELVDMQCGAGINYASTSDGGDMIDTYHPNQNGYDKMGQLWFDEINAINAAPVVSSITVDPANKGVVFETFDLDDYVTDDHTDDADITWTLETTSANYDVVIDGGHVVSVMPKVAEWTGTEDITFVATDDGNIIEALHRSASVTVHFSTENLNDVPVIISQTTTFTPDEDTDVTLALTDLDIDDDDNGISDWTLLVHDGDHYTVSGTTVTPEENYDDQLDVTVTVSDLMDESDPYTVVINYTPVNDEPDITWVDEFAIPEDDTLELELTDFTYDDPDDGDSHSIEILSGTNYTGADNKIYPAANYHGTLRVGVRLTDGDLYSDTTVTVDVTSVNDSIHIVSQAIKESPDDDIYIYQVIAEDPDFEDIIQYSAPVKPEWLEIDEYNGILSGTPDSIGVYDITVQATDGTLTVAQSYVLRIVHVNEPPVVTYVDSIAELDENYAWVIDVEDEDTDIEDIEFIQYTVPDIPDFHFIDAQGAFYYIPVARDTGLYRVKIGISDKIDTTMLEFILNIGEVEYHNTAVEEFVSVTALNIYPNPASDILHIDIESDETIQGIQILSLTGKVLHNEYMASTGTNNVVQMNVGTLPEGMYYMIIRTKEALYTKKVMIQR